MNGNNQTRSTEFLLLELSGKAEQEEVLFGLFLGMYLITVTGNTVILAINCNTHVLISANLSSVNIYFSSFTVPNMLVNHLMGNKHISYMECMTQI
jgi:olfactory receptor